MSSLVTLAKSLLGQTWITEAVEETKAVPCTATRVKKKKTTLPYTYKYILSAGPTIT